MSTNTVDLLCHFCSTPFKKYKGEYNRRIRAGATEFYCTQSCQVRERNRRNPPKGNPENFQHTHDNRRDEYTPFRWFLARVNHRKNKGPHDLTVEYLKELWESQGGHCALTGISMDLPWSTEGFLQRHPRNASLDRVDNSLGYIRGNVRFLCFMANLARSDFTDDAVREFCVAVATTPAST